jgi:hypothetical protein
MQVSDQRVLHLPRELFQKFLRQPERPKEPLEQMFHLQRFLRLSALGRRTQSRILPRPLEREFLNQN